MVLEAANDLLVVNLVATSLSTSTVVIVMVYFGTCVDLGIDAGSGPGGATATGC